MFTSFMQPKYQDNKNDDKKYENSSKCFPNHLITLAAFSFCKEDQEWKVKSKNAHNIKEYSGVTLLLLLSIRAPKYKHFVYKKDFNNEYVHRNSENC